MNTLPPETIGHIIELAVPLTSFKTFRARARTLLSTSLVNRTWRQESQRLLFGHAVVIVESSWGGRSNTSKLMQILQLGGKWKLARHLRVTHPFDSIALFRPPKIVSVDGSSLGSGITALSLVWVTVDPNIFVHCPALRLLVLQIVTFQPAQVATGSTLSKLTDLSIFAMQDNLPACLSTSQLPSLKRLAHSSSPKTWKNGTFGELVQVHYQLDLLCVNISNGYVHHENFLPLADKTLFEVVSSEIERRLDLSDHCRLGVKNVWVPYGTIIEFNRAHESTWSLATFDKLVNATFPNLRTLVLPISWLKSDGFDAFRLLMEKKSLTILFEDKEIHGYGESHICEVFKEYRRGKRVAN